MHAYFTQREKRLSLRLRVASYLDRSRLGIWLELVQAALSLLSCAIYVAESYYTETEVPEWMDVVDLLLSLIFLADFLLHIYIADKKLGYMLSRYGLIDLVTVLPVILGLIISSFNSYRHTFFFARPLRVLRSVRVLRFLPATTKSTAARRQLIMLIYAAFCLVFIFSGLFHYVENNSVLGATVVRSDQAPPYFVPLHEAAYFIVCLAYTVSFGNPVPTNWVGKFVAMSYIVVTALVIPLQIRKLIQIMALQKDGGWVVKKQKNPHYIATGSVKPANFNAFLADFFDARNKRDRTKVVVLSGTVPTEEMDILSLPFMENKVTWLLGSVLLPVDLLRSQARNAAGAFIFADSAAVDPNKEDKLNILRAFALKNHNPNMPISVQLLDASWKMHLDESIFAFALDEVKMNILASSALYPGYSTLLSNMLMWRLQIPLPPNPPVWLKNYAAGLNQTLFEVDIPHRFIGESFSNVVMEVYNQYGIAILGTRKTSAKKITLVPINKESRLTSGGSLVILAEVQQLHEFCDPRFFQDMFMEDKTKRSPLARIPIIKKLAKRVDMDNFRLDVESDNQELKNEAMLSGEKTDMFFHEHYEDSLIQKPSVDSEIRNRKPSAPAKPTPPAPRASRASLVPARMQHRERSFFDVEERVTMRSIAECTVTSLDQHVRNHVILIGCPRSRFGLFHFLQPLLATPRRAGEHPPLVLLLAPEPPSEKTWKEVADLTNILYMKGIGMHGADLQAAGIERARSVVVLSTATGYSSGAYQGKTRITALVEQADALYLQDADVILTARAIQTTLAGMECPPIFTICETAHTKTFDLLGANTKSNTEFFLSPDFAAGFFYDAGITERLIYQCHEKPFIKDIFNKIFTSKNKKRSVFISQIPIPQDLEHMTYGSMFTYAVPRSMVPIGLYRTGEGEGSLASYVTINPPSSTVLHHHDRIFVWCSFMR